MKYRIIKRGDGKYLVQRKKGFFYEWTTVDVSLDDYPDYDHKLPYAMFPSYDAFRAREFLIKDWAATKLEKLVFAAQLENLKKQITVIKEVSV